ERLIPMASGILVVVEQRAGVLKKGGLEAASQARRMAAGGKGPVTALVVGSGLSETAKGAAALGVDRVLVADHPDLALYAPAVVTLRPNVFRADPPPAGASAPVEALGYAPSSADLRSRVVEILAPEEKEIDVAEATIIVSGGRGLKAPENFALVRRLASARR